MKERETGEEEKIEITEMPDKETLEAFLEGFSKEVRVTFNIKTGKFERLRKEND